MKDDEDPFEISDNINDEDTKILKLEEDFFHEDEASTSHNEIELSVSDEQELY